MQTNLEKIIADDYGTIGDLIAVRAAQRPSHAALIMEERTLSYRQLDAAMDRVGAALQRDGLRPGQAIAICAATAIDYITTYLGALRVGVTVAPLAPSSTPQQLLGMVVDCGARLLFVDQATAEALGDQLGRLELAVVSLDDGQTGVRFTDWLAPAGSRPEPVEIDPSSVFNIIYSSGTTGAPKGIAQSHRMRWRNIKRLDEIGYGPDAVTLLSTPLYSNTTLVCLFPTLAGGGVAVLMAKFDARRFLELSQAHRVTHTMLVPVQYRRILEVPDFESFDLTSYQMKFCTSAPFAAALKADVLKRWPGALIEFYGMTEGGVSCVLFAHEHPDKLHTVGQPSAGHEVRLIDDDGKEVGPGDTGEIVGRSPWVMNGYWNQPDLTRQAFWISDSGERFVRTGDVGRFDEDGFLMLMDRKKDMIISGGFNVYPSDLEAVITRHPTVAEVAVVGVPSERWGETPIAFVVLKAGERTEPAELRAWTNEQLGKTQRLTDLRLLASLPRSPIGKILKRELRDSYRPES